jgi:type IX secretion system PorP/SprF family membrane protein
MMNCDPKSAIMYTTKKWFTVVFLLCMAAGAHAQQSVQFSQYIFNGLTVNPAYAGYKDVLNLNADYRQQWSGIQGAPTTGTVSLDGPLKRANGNTNVGLGIQAQMDNLGPQKGISIYGSYAYRIRLDEDDTRRLSIGLGIGVTQYSLDGNTLEYLDTGDRTIPDNGAKETSPDARVGVYYYTPSFYAGLSVMDLFSQYTSSGYKWRGYTYQSIRRKQSLYLTAGYMIPVNEEISVKPSIMMINDFNGPSSVDASAMVYIQNLLWVGGSYRLNVPIFYKQATTAIPVDKSNSASAIIEYYVMKKYRIGYSYDIALNKLAGMQGGTHEISIGILFNSKQYTTSNPRYF